MVPAPLFAGDEEGARQAAGQLREIFGGSNLWIELQRHYLPADVWLVAELLELAGGGPEPVLRGGSAVIAPDGSYLVGPSYDSREAVVADLDRGLIEEACLTLDTDGHYSRPDVFTLQVDTDRQRNVAFDGD